MVGKLSHLPEGGGKREAGLSGTLGSITRGEDLTGLDKYKGFETICGVEGLDLFGDVGGVWQSPLVTATTVDKFGPKLDGFMPDKGGGLDINMGGWWVKTPGWLAGEIYIKPCVSTLNRFIPIFTSNYPTSSY